jgi:hypothetical protein
MQHIAQQWRVACAAGTGSVYGVIQQKFRLSRGWPRCGVIGVAEFLTRRRPISPTSVVMLCGCGHLHCRRSNQRCAQGGQDYVSHWSLLFTRRANLMMELRLRRARAHARHQDAVKRVSPLRELRATLSASCVGWYGSSSNSRSQVRHGNQMRSSQLNLILCFRNPTDTPITKSAQIGCLSPVALHQAARHQRPAVDQHEEDQLERQ